MRIRREIKKQRKLRTADEALKRQRAQGNIPSPTKKELLRKVNEAILTPVIRNQYNSLPLKQKDYFDLWAKSKKVEFLPDGTPYKITSDQDVGDLNGTFVMGVNRPMILVSELLASNAQRKEVARHELYEWKRTYFIIALDRRFISSEEDVHDLAVKSGNPRLRKERSAVT